MDELGWLVTDAIEGNARRGSANAINCYLDRDIDELMTRTRHRSAPAHQGKNPSARCVFNRPRRDLVRRDGVLREPDRGVPDLLAIAFYVVVYTIMLKRMYRRTS